MPEFVEVEAYKHTITPAVGGRIDSIDIRDERLLRRGDEAAVVYGVAGGERIDEVRRLGKVLIVELSSGHSMAMTFGLRGWLSLDDEVARADGSRRTRTPTPEHVRLAMAIGEHLLELEDVLRLATLEIDFDESRLGPDIAAVDKRAFRNITESSGARIKSLLMNQRKVAGVGNLIADEICFQGKVDPRRPADELSPDELDDLWTGLRRTRERVLTRNGSHQGVLIQSGARERGELCPRCGIEIRRVKVGGRTTYFCPEHQR